MTAGGLNAQHLRLIVVRPVLQHLEIHSRAAEDLVVGTAIIESGGLRYLTQLSGGPARGLWQMEPATHDDIFTNWLRARPDLMALVLGLRFGGQDPHVQLATNLAYGAAMCRIHYRRVPTPLPDEGDVEGYAQYWKTHYNTLLGSGKTSDFVDHYDRREQE